MQRYSSSVIYYGKQGCMEGLKTYPELTSLTRFANVAGKYSSIKILKN